jgi:hypothetical protein
MNQPFQPDKEILCALHAFIFSFFYFPRFAFARNSTLVTCQLRHHLASLFDSLVSIDMGPPGSGRPRNSLFPPTSTPVRRELRALCTAPYDRLRKPSHCRKPLTVTLGFDWASVFYSLQKYKDPCTNSHGERYTCILNLRSLDVKGTRVSDKGLGSWVCKGYGVVRPQSVQ